MFLQAAIDTPTLDEALQLVKTYQAIPSIDYIEIGAPLVTHYGCAAFEVFSKYVAPDHLYVDLKMIDFPIMELGPYLELGVRRTSVMAVMNDEAMVQLADLVDKTGLTVFVSLMGYPISMLRSRVKQLIKLGFTNFICHGAGVARDVAFWDMAGMAGCLQDIADANLILAGGIGLDNIGQLRNLRYAGIICGRGLLEGDPDKTAATIRGQHG